jgi:hypothetical protein
MKKPTIVHWQFPHINFDISILINGIPKGSQKDIFEKYFKCYLNICMGNQIVRMEV